jgi:hypothetical protein
MAPPIPGTILPDERKGHGAIKRGGAGERAHGLAARVGQRRMRQTVLGYGAGADQSILGLKEHVHACRHVVGHQGWDADPEIDEHARTEFARDTLGDDGLRVHGFTYW